MKSVLDLERDCYAELTNLRVEFDNIGASNIVSHVVAPESTNSGKMFIGSCHPYLKRLRKSARIAAQGVEDEINRRLVHRPI